MARHQTLLSLRLLTFELSIAATPWALSALLPLPPLAGPALMDFLDLDLLRGEHSLLDLVILQKRLTVRMRPSQQRFRPTELFPLRTLVVLLLAPTLLM